MNLNTLEAKLNLWGEKTGLGFHALADDGEFIRLLVNRAPKEELAEYLEENY